MDCVICNRPEAKFPMVFRGQPTCSVLCEKAKDKADAEVLVDQAVTKVLTTVRKPRKRKSKQA